MRVGARLRRAATAVVARAPLAFMALACAAGSGCSWTDKDGRHHLVLGAGVITVRGTDLAEATTPTADERAKSDSDKAASRSVGVRASGIEAVDALGIFLGPGPIVNGAMIGFSRRQTVIVDPDSDLLMDASRYDDGRLVVTIQPVRPAPTNDSQRNGTTSTKKEPAKEKSP